MTREGPVRALGAFLCGLRVCWCLYSSCLRGKAFVLVLHSASATPYLRRSICDASSATQYLRRSSVQFGLSEEVVPVRRLHHDVEDIAAAREHERHVDAGGAEPPHGPEQLRQAVHP